MNRDTSAAAYAMIGAFLAVASVMIAILTAPWLATWFAENVGNSYGYDYAYAYDYGYPAEKTWADYWPLGSTRLLIAFVFFILSGACVGWLLGSSGGDVAERDEDVRMLRDRIDREIRLVERRRDLNDKEKGGFKQSAHALLGARDRLSREVAQHVASGNALTGAQQLAKEARTELLDRLCNASHLAGPFSDKEQQEIEELRANHERFDELVKAYKTKEANEKKAAKEAKEAQDKAKKDKEDLERLEKMYEDKQREAAELLKKVKELTRIGSQIGGQANGHTVTVEGSKDGTKGEGSGGRARVDVEWDDKG